MKVALFFDIFNEMGGAENIAIILAKHFNADIYTTYVDWNKVNEELKKLKVHQIGLFFKNAKLLTYSEIAFRFWKLKLPKYDVYLFLRVHCFSAAKSHHPNIWIACGIYHALYDTYEYFYRTLSFWQKPIFKIWSMIYRFLDQKWVKNFDEILANSATTVKQVKKYYNRDAKIAYHPVETKRFKCKSYEDFFLMPSRLTREKRVDLVVSAFKERPNKKLIIVGDGPERKKLEEMSKDAKNIKFLGYISSKKLIDLYSRCLATFSVVYGADWGLIPIESMASGKPCIAANDGAHTETVIHNKTGFLIKPEKEEIKKYVNIITPELAKKMKNDCIKRAREFDTEIFLKTVEEEIKKLIGIKKK
jgi:glycosyltransferase involved in cell wall biosynthesis